MKNWKTFLFCLFILILSGYFLFAKKEKCLFFHQGKCFTCQDKVDFWVGLPENCSLCPNRFIQYNENKNASVWTCLLKEENEIPYPTDTKSTCPKEYPLKDIVGNCYSCATNQPVQIRTIKEHVCTGKRYLTEFRLSEKSHKCPPLNQIQNPEICLSCQGVWYQEKCFSYSKSSPSFCQKNEDCNDKEYCYPFRYQIQGKTGICRPQNESKWICSDTDGYNPENARLFCERQKAKFPTLKEIILQKEEIYRHCPHQNIWVYFDEGNLYLQSIQNEYPITNEGLNSSAGGNNFYALCQKD